MNAQHLQDNYPKLISYMETNGYSKIYVDRFKREVKKTLSVINSKKVSCYTDVYREYTKTSSSPSYLRGKRTIIGAIEQFDVHGRYLDGKRRHELFERGAYSLLLPEFKSLIDYYCEAEKKRGGKNRSTIYISSHNASTFFLSLQKKGITSLAEIAEEDVLSIFMSPDETPLKGYSYKKNISAFLKACIPHHPICHRILNFLPALRETRKNIQYLTSEEIQKIKKALINCDNSLTLRDKAIGILALYTGLRACDIAGLILDAIDWDKDLICIIQQKTNFLLELPLTAIVGNAIYDYVTSERPHTESKYLFVSQQHPHDRLGSKGLGNVATRIMKVAGIRQSKGDRKGFHIFRHYFATALLENGIPQSVISRTLGHAAPDSLESYLSADFLHLKECSISIERFPVLKGVFS